MREALKAGFPDEAYSSHPTKEFLTVLKAYYVTERLNDVFGVGRWRVNTEVVERTADYVLVRGEFESLDYDVVCTPQYGGHRTTGKNTEPADGFKSAVTDCTSKIASYLGVGADMFKGKVKSSSGKKGPYKNKKRLAPDQYIYIDDYQNKEKWKAIDGTFWHKDSKRWAVVKTSKDARELVKELNPKVYDHNGGIIMGGESQEKTIDQAAAYNDFNEVFNN